MDLLDYSKSEPSVTVTHLLPRNMTRKCFLLQIEKLNDKFPNTNSTLILQNNNRKVIRFHRNAARPPC